MTTQEATMALIQQARAAQKAIAAALTPVITTLLIEAGAALNDCLASLTGVAQAGVAAAVTAVVVWLTPNDPPAAG